MCLGHDSRIAGGVLVVSVVNVELKEVCSAKVRALGEKVGQAWRLHVHPQDSSKAAYVNRKGEVKWNLQESEVPTAEQCVREDALEVQTLESSVWDGLGLLMTFVHFFQLGKRWSSPRPRQTNLSPKLRQMCLLNIFRCPCAVSAFMSAVPPIAMRVTLRPPLCITFYRGSLGPHRRWWTSLHHFFLRGGGSASFSKIGTSVRSILGTQTLMSMRQFLEDAEKHSEKETGAHDTELEVTDSTTEKTGAYDPEPEVMDSSTSAQKVDAQREAITALRMLFEDFEDQVKYRDEVSEENSSESEGPPEEMQVADPLAHLSHILPHQEDEDTLIPNKEPQIYMCDDWIRACGSVE